MARQRIADPGSTAKYYRANGDAREKKNAYMRKYNKKPSRIRYRAKLNKARRDRGIYGKGGGDMSHDSKGRLSRQSLKINRANNGHGKRPRYRTA
jgi:hypothetical protein